MLPSQSLLPLLSLPVTSPLLNPPPPRLVDLFPSHPPRLLMYFNRKLLLPRRLPQPRRPLLPRKLLLQKKRRRLLLKRRLLSLRRPHQKRLLPKNLLLHLLLRISPLSWGRPREVVSPKPHPSLPFQRLRELLPRKPRPRRRPLLLLKF